MGSDYMIVPGMNHRRSKEDIMKDVRSDAAQWYNREFKERMKSGDDRQTIARELEEKTEKWVALEFQRRMNLNDEEESTEPLH